MTELMRVLMSRDGLTSREAQEAINEARELILNGESPEDVLAEEFGLEPDYLYDII